MNTLDGAHLNIYTNEGKTYIALNGYKRRAGYDFNTGSEIWYMIIYAYNAAL
jgi:hypothetical protein